MERSETSYEIRGTVSGRKGELLRGARVAVWWQHIRERRELVAGETSDDGGYRLIFELPRNAPEPMVVVEARSEELEAPLVSGLTKVQAGMVVDLSASEPDQSEWAVLMRSIAPLLDGLGLSDLVEDSTHQDITFLATELGKSTEILMRVAVSARLETAYKIPAAVFYAFLRQQVPAALPSPLYDASHNFTLISPLVQSIASQIFGLSAAVQTRTITSAIALDLIGTQYTQQIAGIVSQLQALHTTDLLQQPYLVGSATLGELLTSAALPAAKQQAFAQALASSTQSMRNFWRTLGNGQNGFTEAEASAIERTLSIGAFVKNYVPLVQNLFQGFSGGTYKTLPDLARLSLADWERIVTQTGAPPNIDAAGTSTPAQVFAAVIYARVTRAYPTAALSSRIAAGTFVPAAQQKPLTQFFQNNPELELMKDNIPVYLAAQGANAFTGIDAQDQAVVIANARSFQRVLRISPNTDIAQSLLGAGLSSSTAIAALGQQQLFLKATAAGLTKPEANQVYRVAAQRYASVVSLYMQLNRDAMGVMPQGMNQGPVLNNAMQEAVRVDPSLTTLFGSQDYCAVDDCTTVLSPAAYLCDLLLWLRNHPQGGQTALDVLDARRPDIRHLLLNCPNSDTELPYIDLVIELLADKVSPPPATQLAAAIDGSQLSITVASAAGFPAVNFTVVIGPESLLVTAMSGVGNTTWTVVRAQDGTTGTPAAAAAAVILTTAMNPPWKQTSADLSSAQLSAAPAFFNQGAFVTLFSASYPRTLPYSAGLDELRAYLLQWNLPLWQLRQALLPITGATVAQQAAVAAERLGMNTQAESLVTTAGFVTPAVAWNTGSPATDLVAVTAFLQAASIPYESLLELLEVAWVQGGLNVGISGISDTCMISGQTLTPSPLDAGFLDRANRFLRLWTSTGYRMWELDLLLTAPSVGNGTLDQSALAGLQAFWQLQQKTGASVNAQLAYYQGIDIASHRDSGGSTTPLYTQIFLDPTTTWIAPDPDLVSLSTGGAIGDPVLSHHVKAIQPAIGVSAADLATLIALTDNQLTLANLSLIYRVNALAAAAKLTITNLLNLAVLLRPTAAAPSTTLAAGITAAQSTIQIANATPFRPPTFYAAIGAEVLLVTAMTGPGNATWTVVRGQLGTTPAAAAAGAAVTSDAASPVAALAALFQSPSATLTFLSQAATVLQQTGLSVDGITYLLNPPSTITGGWATTSQIAPTAIAATLSAVQAAVLSLLSASTTLVTGIGAGDTTITVAADAGFPAPNFYVYIGSEILLVTAAGGAGNATWTVVRGQQGTTAVAAVMGAAVTPTFGDLTGAVISAVAANAHSVGVAPLAADVTALILETLQLPGSGQPLVAILMDPSLLAATGTITIGGTPTAGDALQVVLNNGIAPAVTVSYVLTATDSGSVNQTASDFAAAINASAAVTGTKAFLAPCTVAGSVIALIPLAPGAAGSSITSTNTATPGGVGHISISPATTETVGLPAFKNQFTAIQYFDKVAMLVRGLKLVATDLSWLLANSGNAAVGGLDFMQFPVTSGQPALSLTNLLTTLLAIKLARLWTSAAASSSVHTLYDVIGGVLSGGLVDAPSAQTALATITGWPLADIESFSAALGLVYPASYEAPATYDAMRVLEAMSTAVDASGPVVSAAETALAAAIATTAQNSITVVSAVGFPTPNFYINIGLEILLVTGFSGADNTTWAVTRAQLGTMAATPAAGTAVTLTYGAQIVSWGSVPADEVSAESLAASALGILKAQTPSQDAWLALAPTLMNPLRENRSAALQAYLMAQRDGAGNPVYPDADGLPTADGLFNYFLIDNQMTSCQVTSRIVQAYIAVQVFVERCLMNLESPQVVVDLTKDDTWNQWEWMSRYRVWEANREVFLYPENWLIESERPNRTEIYQKFEQEVRGGEATTDYLETVVLNYIDRMDGLAHLLVTGTCEDPATGTIYVVARTLTDPPLYYLRSYVNGAWGGWEQIPLSIKAHQVIPALYRGRICLFWMDVKVSNEPQQSLPSAEQSATPPSQTVDRYVSLAVNFSIYRNGSWAPSQAAKGKLFDKPFYDPAVLSDANSIEAFYTLKVQTPAPTPGYGANLFVDVFRLGDFEAWGFGWLNSQSTVDLIVEENDTVATHLGRAVFDGRFSDLELRDLQVPAGSYAGNPLQLLPVGYNLSVSLLSHAQSTYGPDAQPLLPLPDNQADPDLVGDSGLMPMAGALATGPANPAHGSSQTMVLEFTSTGALEQGVGPILNAAAIPLRVVGPDSDLNFDPTSYFFFQDNRRSYFVESQKYYWTGSFWAPVVPSDPSSAPFKLEYVFHLFYHPFTRLFWNQLSAGEFDLLYDPALQQAPDSVDPTYSDVFSFQSGYQPVVMRVSWDHADASTMLAAAITAAQTTITVTTNVWVPSPTFYVSIGSEVLKVTSAGGTIRTEWTVVRGQLGTVAAAAAAGTAVTPTYASQDRQFLDFSPSAPFSVYNWELFYHIPLYIAQLLSQNQQFEDAQSWYHYIFNPTLPGGEPVPQRFWIPKPLRNLTSADILAQQINNLLLAVNQGNATAVQQIETWRNDPFNPFVLADQRPVAYMKSTVMSYLDNLIAWGDNLFSTESREALAEATLLYVIASEVLGPAPQAVTPPERADQSFDELEPALDAFANAMVEIENVIGSSGSGGGSGSGSGGGIPNAQTFYFKIPPNQTLLSYWSTVADRLYKLRHCQNLAGAPLQLALFDAPIDPGLLIAAQSAGVDLSSVLSDMSAPLPNYRFTALYPQAVDFVNAVRAYGAALQAALEKSDAGALALLQQTTQQQLLTDGNDVLEWQVEQAANNVEALQQALALVQSRHDYNAGQSFMNDQENAANDISIALNVTGYIAALAEFIAVPIYDIPTFCVGASGFGATPVATASLGGKDAASGIAMFAAGTKTLMTALDNTAKILTQQGNFHHRQDTWNQNAAEAQIQISQTQYQIAAANLALQVAQQNQVLHQEQIDNIQKQLDFLNSKFTNDALYTWMVSSLSETYFLSYQLAYQMCKQVERCYQFELGLRSTSFIQFGYWDSLYKGLLAGETLNHDLRRMQSSYLQQNSRRFEISRYVSLGILDPTAFQKLLLTGACDFTLPESLFDLDYPGHYNRRLTRVSMTVVYPSPGKFDNVKATLTMVSNQVRVSTDTTAGYEENPVGSDSRFVYNYASVPQKIVLGSAQDDPGLFITAIASNIVDQRYLPFENAGVVSSWHLEMPQINNEVDLSTVGDVWLHLYYTALDGGGGLQTTVEAYNAANLPTTGVKLFSAQNDFAAASATLANPYPMSPWQAFVTKPFAVFTTLAWPINATQTSITVGSNANFPGVPFLVNIDEEILQVTAVGGTSNTTWTVTRGQQGSAAAAHAEDAVYLLPAAAGSQLLTLAISPSKFPAWTRGKTLTVTSITVLAIAWPPTPFTLVPQTPLPTAPINMLPVAGVTEPAVYSSGVIALPPGTGLGTWSFELQLTGATNFSGLTKNSLGDVLLLVNYQVT
jgi:hypothetical protein